MKTERFRSSNSKFSSRGFLFALAASSMLLMNNFNTMDKYGAESDQVDLMPENYASDTVIIQVCRETATIAHSERMLNSVDRAGNLRNVTIGTSIVFGVAAAVLGGIAMAPLVPVVLIIGGIEYAWMQSQISTQLAEAEARSSNQLAADNVKCVEDHANLLAELGVIDHAGTTFQYSFTSGS